MTTDFVPSPGAAVYGVIMNDRVSLARMGEAAAQPPYNGLPEAPVLYIKPRNTWARLGAEIALPRGEARVEVGAVVGLRMGADAARLTPETALGRVDACLLAADLSLPHEDYFRPAIRQKCFDGALPMVLLDGLAVNRLPDLVLRTRIDDRVVDERALSDLILGPAQLLAAVSEFMTLRQGDVLLTGVVYRSPLAEAGSAVRIEASGLADLDFTLAAGEGAI
uniref:fumarylacetoacetate hydrolase family protein n=1 Tax=Castellaniella defragrans TaxID=75697 RepID=UPI00334206F4